MSNELLEFPGGVLGVALNLDVRSIGAVILGDANTIEEGQEVTRTGEVLSVPVGDAFLGRVINPLGQPIDGLGEIEAETTRPLELQAASVVQRQGVNEPLQTGIKAIDAMTPIGRGQRQLIIGDRKTGKTAVCVDTIINQKQYWDTGDDKLQVRCIYVAIGQKGTTIAGVRQSLEDAGALAYTTIVAAPASDSAGFKWLAPYTGSAIGQHWMYQGKHVLIIFDDLSKQAEAYRAISLLLRRPPGREAYPGDVFYLHSRLLERCAKLSDELGAGSMTGLPIIETKAGDVSAYIPTNVISITDGQCFLQGDLFNSGVRPGRQRRHLGLPGRRRRAGQGHAQGVRHAASRPVRLPRAGGVRRLRLRPGRGVEAGAGPRLAAGRAAQAAAVQPVSRCEEQVVSIWAGTRGHLDRVPVQDIRRFEGEFLQYLRHAPGSPLEAIKSRARPVRRDREGALVDALAEFSDTFTTSEGVILGGSARSKPMDESEVGQEKVQVRRAAPASDRRRRTRTSGRRSGAGGDMMAAQVRVLRQRVRAVKSTQKTTKAQEMIATSRIAKAQAKVAAAAPYSKGITDVLTALASASTLDHPLLNERENPSRAGILLITSDRGLCGGYNANAIKRRRGAQRAAAVAGQGRRAIRHRPQGRWLLHVPAEADPGSPGRASRRSRPTPTPNGRPTRCCRRSIAARRETTEDGAPGIDEMHLVSTHFVSMMTQSAQARRMAPLEVEYVEHDTTQGDRSCCRRTSSSRRRSCCWTRCCRST